MFCACVGIVFCLLIIIGGAVISSVDLVRYDFGLYYVLLAIVALMGSLTLCVIRPTKFCGVRDPKWYTQFCEGIHDALVAAHQKHLREQQQIMEMELVELGTAGSGGTVTSTTKRTGQMRHQRATLMMLGPAVELMHHVIHGVAERMSEDEATEEQGSAEVGKAGPAIWWDTVQASAQSPARKCKQGRKKKKRRKRKGEQKTEHALYTIPSVPSDLAEMSSGHLQNSAGAVSLQVHYQYAEEGNTDNEVFL